MHWKQGPIQLNKVVLLDLDYYWVAITNTSPGKCSIAQDRESHRQIGGNSCPEDILDLAPEHTLGMTALHIQWQDALSLHRYIIKGLVLMRIVNKIRHLADSSCHIERRQSATDQPQTSQPQT
jgi:hypothetical protein